MWLGVPNSFSLEPTQWLLDSASRIETTVAEVVSADALLASLSAVDIETTAATLRSAVQAAATRQAAIVEESLLIAPIDPARVELLAGLIKERWRRRRLAATLFRTIGSYEEVALDNPSASFGYCAYEPKDWYVDERVGGLESHAAGLADKITKAENAKLWGALANSRALPRTKGDVNERLIEAVGKMERLGYSPSVVFVPRRPWQLRLALGLERADTYTDVVDDHVIGFFHGLRVVEAFDLASDRIVIADLAAFAAWRQWRQADDALTVSVRAFTEADARAAVQANRNLMRRQGRTRLADRARELRRSVLVEVLEQFTLEVTDGAAARAVPLPPAIARG
jgi:hypothetical protein